MSRPTEVISVDPKQPDPSVIEHAASILRRGGLVAFATETVYGLGADATNPDAVMAIFEAKGRPSQNPLIVHVDSTEMAKSCVAEWPDVADLLALHYWPGPLSLVLPRTSRIPDAVTAGLPTVGIRNPRPLVAQDLIERVGRPIAAPSANRSNRVSPTLASHVFKDLEGRIDLILDSGQTDLGLESTVVDLTTRQPRVLRPGPVSASELESLIGPLRVVEIANPGAVDLGVLTSPGQLPVHYAPQARTLRVETPEDLARLPWTTDEFVRVFGSVGTPEEFGLLDRPERVALVIIGTPELPSLPAALTHRFHLPDPETAGRDLYVVLHQCDALGVSLIVIVPPPDRREWHTIRDRLWRASRPWRE